MGRKKSLRELKQRLVLAEHPKMGCVVTYNTEGLGTKDTTLVAWRCWCDMEQHVTFRTCRSAKEKVHALRCYFCHGDPPAPKRKIGGPSAGEAELRAVLHEGWPDEVMAAQVRPWKKSKRIDIYLPLRRLVIEHDGRSHVELMPHDRKKGEGSKLKADRDFDKAAEAKGFKVLRLHQKDKTIWKQYIFSALASPDDCSPMYSPNIPL